MKGKVRFSATGSVVRRLPAMLAGLLAVALVAAAAKRIHLHPQFTPGETLYYRIETHTLSTGKSTTPIINPEGGTKFNQAVDLLVQISVLPDSGAGERAADGVRLRLKYERAHADSQSDAPQLDAPPASEDYDGLEGHSFEMMLSPQDAISNFQDTDNTLPNATEALMAFSWIKELVAANGFPRRGIAIGDKWTSERPVDGAFLMGLVWRAESDYLRNEPCKSIDAAGKPEAAVAGAAKQCAVILTRFEIVRHGSSHADQTPPDYLRHGLRTAGTLTGSGESLDSFSLASGLLVSATQSSTQRADFDIINAANGEKIHRVGQVQTQTSIAQVPAPPAGARH